MQLQKEKMLAPSQSKEQCTSHWVLALHPADHTAPAAPERRYPGRSLCFLLTF